MKSKTIGYGFKLSSESFSKALSLYEPGGFLNSKQEVQKEIKKAKRMKDISKNSKPVIFKVKIEIV